MLAGMKSGGHKNVKHKEKYHHWSSKAYQQAVIRHRDLEVPEHGERPWISEQELRDLCAFFRIGESSTRATLSILRALKRLNQVCGRNSQFTCVCLPLT